ncbi:MAG: RecQ family ATP-dependent DNA helicase, partial [Prevotellaceae bacterium]|nr:RecQ family ATP-dependent DNA helicase [Prevotellaceae bacterium]
ATPKVQHDVQKNLGMLDAMVFKSSFNRPNLYYEVRQKTKDVDKDIIKYIRSQQGKSGIIYCLSRRKVEELAETLQLNDVSALPYHAGLEQMVRSTNQDAFLMEKCDVIVATIAFGMGIDKPDVRYVIHYDMPKSLEGYYQETGRGGRDGGEGQCIAFYSIKDLDKLRKFQQGKPIAEQEIGNQLLLETQAYAESSICRRKLLLHYFGENYKEENCHSCDNCLKVHKTVEGQELLTLILETVHLVKEKFKAEHIIDILKGNETADVKSYQHDRFEQFATATDEADKFLQSIIRQALIAGYLSKEIENYGLLKLTSAGKAYLKKPTSFPVVKDTEFDEDDDDPALRAVGGGSGAADDVLFSILKDLRKKLSKKLDVPPFVIFQDPSLEAMATSYPITIEELQNVSGVGMGKAKRYGEEFVKIIAQHVKDNEIERPEDLRVRSAARKSAMKVSIIQAIDRKVALDDIAESKGLDFNELLNEVEAIVYSGTKIHIDYFLQEVMEPDHVQEIFDYFNNAETDNVQQALEELGEDEFSKTEVRLVRIKFLSEVGN